MSRSLGSLENKKGNTDRSRTLASLPSLHSAGSRGWSCLPPRFMQQCFDAKPQPLRAADSAARCSLPQHRLSTPPACSTLTGSELRRRGELCPGGGHGRRSPQGTLVGKAVGAVCVCSTLCFSLAEISPGVGGGGAVVNIFIFPFSGRTFQVEVHSRCLLQTQPV